MRLQPEELKNITGLERPAAQVRWFKLHYGVNLTHDRRGVVLTKAAFEGMVAKQCGLMVAANQPRPTVHNVRHLKAA